MVEVGAEVREPRYQSEIGGDRTLTEIVERRIQEGESEFYHEGGWQVKPRFRPAAILIDEGENLVTIRPQEEKKEETVSGQAWLTRPVLVEITTYRLRTVTPRRKEYLSINFPGRKTAEEEGRPWVHSVSPEEENGLIIYKPTPSRAGHQKRVALAIKLLSKGIPIKDIAEPEQAEKLEITGVLKISSSEAMAKLDDEQVATLLEKPTAALVKLFSVRPVLAGLVVEQMLGSIENQIAEGKLKVGEMLTDPTMRVLTNEGILQNEETARRISRFLAGELLKTELEGEELDGHPITEFLRARWGDNYVLYLGPDLLKKFPAEIRGEALVEAEREVRVMKVSQEVRRKLLVLAMGAGVGIETGTFFSELRLESFGKQLPLNLYNALLYGGAAVGLSSSLAVIFSARGFRKKLEAARKREEILKKVAPPSAEEAVGESEGPVE